VGPAGRLAHHARDSLLRRLSRWVVFTTFLLGRERGTPRPLTALHTQRSAALKLSPLPVFAHTHCRHARRASRTSRPLLCRAAVRLRQHGCGYPAGRQRPFPHHRSRRSRAHRAPRRVSVQATADDTRGRIGCMSDVLLAIALAAPEWGRSFISDNSGGFYRTIDIVPNHPFFWLLPKLP
jgi:hypothetical protein